MTQVVEVHNAADSHVLADTVMGFADYTQVLAGFPGTREDPVLVGIARRLVNAAIAEVLLTL